MLSSTACTAAKYHGNSSKYSVSTTSYTAVPRSSLYPTLSLLSISYSVSLLRYHRSCPHLHTLSLPIITLLQQRGEEKSLSQIAA
mmetsp:Transcript_45308/g.117254  ORF Transcript_45308/g.117254 Transcript_45308/m.117254 type:complete len:85 (-) Transcript_45308:2112-2366(-)